MKPDNQLQKNSKMKYLIIIGLVLGLSYMALSGIDNATKQFIANDSLRYYTYFLAAGTVISACCWCRKVNQEKEELAAEAQRQADFENEELLIANKQLWRGASEDAVFRMFGNPEDIDYQVNTKCERKIMKFFPKGRGYSLKITTRDGLVEGWEDTR